VSTKTLEEPPPRQDTHWSTRQKARATGLSQTAISRIWRAFGLKPHLVETWKLSADPQFIDKVRDIVGLYLDPPQAALVRPQARSSPSCTAATPPEVLEVPQDHRRERAGRAGRARDLRPRITELTTRKLRRSAQRSVAELEADRRAWIEAWNQDPKPFVWTKTADEILDNLARYLHLIDNSGH
jgi:hypothetical protein